MAHIQIKPLLLDEEDFAQGPLPTEQVQAHRVLKETAIDREISNEAEAHQPAAKRPTARTAVESTVASNLFKLKDSRRGIITQADLDSRIIQHKRQAAIRRQMRETSKVAIAKKSDSGQWPTPQNAMEREDPKNLQIGAGGANMRALGDIMLPAGANKSAYRPNVAVGFEFAQPKPSRGVPTVVNVSNGGEHQYVHRQDLTFTL